MTKEEREELIQLQATAHHVAQDIWQLFADLDDPKQDRECVNIEDIAQIILVCLRTELPSKPPEQAQRLVKLPLGPKANSMAGQVYVDPTEVASVYQPEANDLTFVTMKTCSSGHGENDYYIVPRFEREVLELLGFDYRRM